MPTIKNPLNLKYTVSFATETRKFVFDETNNQVNLHETFEAQIVKSQNCPRQDFFVLKFDFLVENESKAIEHYLFVPVYAQTKQESTDLGKDQEINIARLDFNSSGVLKVVFNKEIHPPPLNVVDPSSQVNNRELSTKSTNYEITEVVSLIVEDVLLD